ncbi:MAG TPA: NUDIX domain-containing protein [Caulobacteraceae bacterium]
MSTWRRTVEPWTRPAIRTWARATRGMTLGVRGVVTDAEGRVLLIEHTYVHGWHLPGGGVERGQTAEEAMANELVEEAGVRAIGRPRLVSFHDNGARYPGDHILLYRITDWEPVEATSRGEIHRVGFFPRRELPEGATPGTRRRIAEVFGGAAADPRW